MDIKLTEQDLQKIYDAALYDLKSGSNTAVDSHLWPILCTITAFVNYVNKQDNCIALKYPQPRNWQSIDDE